MKKDLRVYADDIYTVQQIEKVRRSAQEMQICCIAYTDKIQYHRYIKKIQISACNIQYNTVDRKSTKGSEEDKYTDADEEQI